MNDLYQARLRLGSESLGVGNHFQDGEAVNPSLSPSKQLAERKDRRLHLLAAKAHRKRLKEQQPETEINA